MLDVDPEGFDLMDRKLLEAVIHRFDGGPVGLDNIAASICEQRDTIAYVFEPHPLQPAYLPPTPRRPTSPLRHIPPFVSTPPKNFRSIAPGT